MYKPTDYHFVVITITTIITITVNTTTEII